LSVKPLLGGVVGLLKGTNIGLDSDLLVNGVNVDGRSAANGLFFVVLEDNDAGVFGFVRVLHGAVCDDGEDPDHAEENADSAANDKGDGAALPRTQRHQSGLHAEQEGLVIVGHVVHMGVSVVVVVVIRFGHSLGPEPSGTKGRSGMGKDANLIATSSLSVPSLRSGTIRTEGDPGWRSHHWNNLPFEGTVAMSVMTTRLTGFDERKAESLSESVGNFDGLLLHSVHATSAWSVVLFWSLSRDEDAIDLSFGGWNRVSEAQAGDGAVGFRPRHHVGGNDYHPEGRCANIDGASRYRSN
jgi:hypothetical protein